MLIENVDAFKSWLAKLLDPICDADPSALANYVIALVKKDKSEKELKAICADQLDVFLQKETNGFVDKLFDGLNTKNYLPPDETLKPIVKLEKEELKDDFSEKRHMAVPAALPDAFEEDRDLRKKKHPSPLRNRSDSSERRSRDKKREDGKWREYDRHRDKYDWRRGRSKSPPKSKSANRSRSRSRGRSRDREPTRGRGSGVKGNLPQPTSSLIQHRERPKFECERSELEPVYTPCSSQAVSFSTEPQYSSGGQAIPSTVTVIAPAHHPESTTEIWSNYYNNHNPPNSFSRNPPAKRRCRDYDERGYCILGDLCQFDHGNDPLVVDDVSLPSMIPFPPPPGLPPPGILMPPIPGHHNMRLPISQPIRQPPPSVVPPATRLPLSHSTLVNNSEQQISNPVPTHTPMPRLPPPLPPQNLLYSVSEHTYEPDGYNPEAPSLTNTGRTAYRQFFTRTQTQRPNLIGLTSGDMDNSPRAANIVIKTEPPPPPVPVNSNVNRVVVEPDRKRPLGAIDGPFAKKAWIDKQGNNNHNKVGFIKTYTNTKLEVRKIPPDLNNITKLNEHFNKFGTISNIQVAFQGDPEGALIQYLTNEEARRAISSTEAVLNNRFIRVLWHRENNEQQTTLHQQHMPHHTQHLAQAVPSSLTAAGQGHMTKVISKPPNQGSYSLNKLPIKHRLGSSGSSQPDTTYLPANQTNSGEDAQTLPPSSSHSKMVYSSTNMRSSNKQLSGSKPADVQDAIKKKQEALKLQQDMRKKKQEMLEKRIEYQKMLISRLEKNKTMKAEERNEIMKTLKELDEKISQAKDELKMLATPSKVKSKTEAQKELLDAEMDFHKRLTSGEDTTELKKKLSQLQIEAARLGILPPGRGGKGVTTQGRGRGRGRGTRGRGILNHMVVDHRPKTISISGFFDKDKEELVQHFSKFGEVEDLKEEEFPPGVNLTFKTRQEAENISAFFKAVVPNRGPQVPPTGQVFQISEAQHR
uniref:RNA binding motif protein 27 n=1 Tax=Leptobrachium leishanense TaxID=445787 RepID=A0A8C5R0A2_9ANUR